MRASRGEGVKVSVRPAQRKAQPEAKRPFKAGEVTRSADQMWPQGLCGSSHVALLFVLGHAALVRCCAETQSQSLSSFCGSACAFAALLPCPPHCPRAIARHRVSNSHLPTQFATV